MRHAVAGIGIDNGKIKLVFAGVEINEKIVDFVQDFLGARIGAVDLVQHDYRRELRCKCLLQNVTRLRQRPFAGVDQHHNTIHHAQRALHFAAKVAVSRGVHDVDLGKNGDAALAFEVV